MRVEWKAPPGGKRDEIIRYRLERRGVDKSGSRSKAFGNTIYCTSNTHIVTELASDTCYEFRVCAESEVGNSLWSPISDAVRTRSHAFYNREKKKKKQDEDLPMGLMLGDEDLPMGLMLGDVSKKKKKRQRRETSRRTNMMLQRTGASSILNLSSALLVGDDAVPPESGLTPRKCSSARISIGKNHHSTLDCRYSNGNVS